MNIKLHFKTNQDLDTGIKILADDLCFEAVNEENADIVISAEKADKNILKLDLGFEGLYNKVGKTVANNPSEYKMHLSKMQKLITEVTEKSVSIQAEEERNKALIESRFNREKNRIKSGRSSSRVARDYYNNMNKLNHIDSQFWDKKS